MRERQTILQFQQIIPILSEKSGIINENGLIIASNDENEVNLLFPEFNNIKSMDSKFFIYENYAYMRINVMDEKTYFLFIEVLPEDNIETKREILSLVALNIETVVNKKDTENNRDKLFRDLILEKIDMDKADILAFDLGIKKNEKRVVFCVEYFDSRVKDNISELLEELFEAPDKEDVYILTIDENHIALIVPYKLCREAEEMEELAAGIAESIETEFVIESKIGIGTIANGFSDIPSARKWQLKPGMSLIRKPGISHMISLECQSLYTVCRRSFAQGS